MKRAIITSLAVLLAWSTGHNFAAAQFGTLGQPPIRPRPTVSPYINMGTGGGGAMSYYGLVRPQMDAQRSIMDLQNTLTRMNPDGSLQGQIDQQNQANALGGLQTGHTATFLNYGNYYPMTPSVGAGNRGQGGNLGVGQGMGGYNPGVGSGTGLGGARPFYGSTFSR